MMNNSNLFYENNMNVKTGFTIIQWNKHKALRWSDRSLLETRFGKVQHSTIS